MRVPPPDVSDADVAECLAASWGVQVDEIAYAPVGFGSHHWHVLSRGEHLFVTVDVVRELAALTAALGTAAAVNKQGLEFAHAALSRADGGLLDVVAGRHPIALHRWIEGVTASDSEQDRTEETLALLAGLHSVDPASTPARHTDLVIQERAGFETALRRLGHRWPGPYGEQARAVLREHTGRLIDLFAIHDRQAAKMLGAQDDWVVTHGEPHAHNLIVGADGLHLIDWDTALIAPAARDVWQVGGDDAVEQYRELTGRVVSKDDVDHFRREWDLAEVCQYATAFAAPHEQTADTAIMWGGFVEAMDRLRS